ncbi:hypothetical protein [Streptomyces sp. NPDC059009]|uniref:hypothetical protein n=1 Tax=Streptomyces sp. NPDC059009 TaxID=3346694 RepID=UPI0036BD77BB
MATHSMRAEGQLPAESCSGFPPPGDEHAAAPTITVAVTPAIHIRRIEVPP